MTRYAQIKLSDIVVENRIRSDLGEIGDLAESIKENGLICPITVYAIEKGKYRIVTGERRYRACQLLEYTYIDTLITDKTDDEHLLNVEASENLARKGFNLIEKVDTGLKQEKIQSLKSQERQRKGAKADGEKGSTEEIVANFIGLSRSTYRKCKYIVTNRNQLTNEEIEAWSNEEKGYSTDKIYRLIKSRIEEKELTSDDIADEILETTQVKTHKDDTYSIRELNNHINKQYGQGCDTYAKDAIKYFQHLKSTKQQLKYYNDFEKVIPKLTNIFQSYTDMFKSKQINRAVLRDLSDDIQYYMNCMKDTYDTLSKISSYSHSIIDTMQEIRYEQNHADDDMDIDYEKAANEQEDNSQGMFARDAYLDDYNENDYDEKTGRWYHNHDSSDPESYAEDYSDWN